MTKIKYITAATICLAKACDASPILTTTTILLGLLFFNIFEWIVETLIYGERFVHSLDLIFTGLFIAWAAYAVYICAVVNTNKDS